MPEPTTLDDNAHLLAALRASRALIDFCPMLRDSPDPERAEATRAAWREFVLAVSEAETIEWKAGKR